MADERPELPSKNHSIDDIMKGVYNAVHPHKNPNELKSTFATRVELFEQFHTKEYREKFQDYLVDVLVRDPGSLYQNVASQVKKHLQNDTDVIAEDSQALDIHEAFLDGLIEKYNPEAKEMLKRIEDDIKGKEKDKDAQRKQIIAEKVNFYKNDTGYKDEDGTLAGLYQKIGGQNRAAIKNLIGELSMKNATHLANVKHQKLSSYFFESEDRGRLAKQFHKRIKDNNLGTDQVYERFDANTIAGIYGEGIGSKWGNPELLKQAGIYGRDEKTPEQKKKEQREKNMEYRNAA